MDSYNPKEKLFGPTGTSYDGNPQFCFTDEKLTGHIDVNTQGNERLEINAEAVKLKEDGLKQYPGFVSFKVLIEKNVDVYQFIVTFKRRGNENEKKVCGGFYSLKESGKISTHVTLDDCKIQYTKLSEEQKGIFYDYVQKFLDSARKTKFIDSDVIGQKFYSVKNIKSFLEEKVTNQWYTGKKAEEAAKKAASTFLDEFLK